MEACGLEAAERAPPVSTGMRPWCTDRHRQEHPQAGTLPGDQLPSCEQRRAAPARRTQGRGHVVGAQPHLSGSSWAPPGPACGGSPGSSAPPGPPPVAHKGQRSGCEESGGMETSVARHRMRAAGTGLIADKACKQRHPGLQAPAPVLQRCNATGRPAHRGGPACRGADRQEQGWQVWRGEARTTALPTHCQPLPSHCSTTAKAQPSRLRPPAAPEQLVAGVGCHRIHTQRQVERHVRLRQGRQGAGQGMGGLGQPADQPPRVAARLCCLEPLCPRVW